MILYYGPYRAIGRMTWLPDVRHDVIVTLDPVSCAQGYCKMGRLEC